MGWGEASRAVAPRPVARDYAGMNLGIAMGTVAAHELTHNINRMFDQPYYPQQDNRNLMTGDSASDQKVDTRPDDVSLNPIGFSALSPDQVKNLFQHCKRKHKSN
jgi:hypothetical protein